MYLEQFVYKIIDYLVITTRHTTNNQGDTRLVLYLEYSYKMGISSLKSHKSVTLMFHFDRGQKLYILTNYKLPMGLMEFLVKDKMLINKDHNYYLTESALLRII